MVTIIQDSVLEQRLKAERMASGADRYDEVWDGVYMMAPLPNNEHQLLVGRFTRVLDEIVTDAGLGEVLPGVNVSDRVDDWEHNYRVPDVAVYLKTTQATNHDRFWHGGPDFAIEIVSRHDQARDKLAFYGKVGTRELLIVDRDPWQLELYRLVAQQMQLQATASPNDGSRVVSQVRSLEASLESAETRPRIHVTHTATARTWTI